MRKTLREPALFVDDHHGQYMGQIAWEQLADKYKKQARKQLSKEDVQAIKDGPENEWHHEAMDKFTNVVFKSPTGQKSRIDYAEGGMWEIPFCFLRTKKADEFFGG